MQVAVTVISGPSITVSGVTEYALQVTQNPAPQITVQGVGLQGIPGPRVELEATETAIRWRWVGGDWADLVAIDDLRGDDGANGADGINGTNGTNGANGADGADGLDGADGREVELRATETAIEWRLTGGDWAAIVQLADLKGADGTTEWDDLNGVPETFPPATHGHGMSDITGLVDALQALAEVEALPSGGTPGQVLTRTADGAEWADLVIVVGVDGGNAFTERA